MTRNSFRYLCHLWIVLLVVAPAQAGDFLGKPAAGWMTELADSRPDVRRGAAFALGKCASVEAVPALVRALEDNEVAVRDAAAYALGEIAAEHKESALWETAGPALRKLLTEDPDPRARRSAACAIGHFGPLAAGARPDLEQALDHKDGACAPERRLGPGPAQGQGGSVWGGSAGPRLRDDDAGVRRDAAAALNAIGRPTAVPALPALIACLAHEKAPEVRTVAVTSLVALVGPQDRGLAADLRDLLREDDREVRRGAALALANLGGADGKLAVPVLLDALNDDDATTRELAASALAHLGEAAGDAVPALGKALSDRAGRAPPGGRRSRPHGQEGRRRRPPPGPRPRPPGTRGCPQVCRRGP